MQHPVRADVESAVEALRRGEVVAYPTDTVFGLGADALNAAAVRRVFAAKGRDEGRPIPILLAATEDVVKVASDFPADARLLTVHFWPGALTVVLSATKEVPLEVTAGSGTVGVRVPDHPVPRELARRLGRPITGTSANSSGRPPHKTADEVARDIGDRVAFIVTGDCGTHDAPSTVVDFTRSIPTVVRAGAITVEELRRLVPGVVG